MKYCLNDYLETSSEIRKQIGDFSPEVLMILGSGLSYLAEEAEDPIRIRYADLSHMPVSHAPGHAGQFVFGNFSGKKVMMMQGRVHTYEGYTSEEVVFPVRLAYLLGVRKMLVTNAAGAVNTDYHAGEIMIIKDHIKMMGDDPLTGLNIPEFGPRFPDMTYAYDPEYRTFAKEEADHLGLRLNEGVYMFFCGPQYETPAEIRAARVLGADAVGMSTVPEVIAAAHCGMRVLGFSLSTNMAAGVLDQRLSEEEVLEAAEKAKNDFAGLVRACIRRI